MKQKRYWLRGGVIGFLGVLILLLIMISLGELPMTWQWNLWIKQNIFEKIWELLEFPFPPFDEKGLTRTYLLPFFYSIIGVVLGWFYGKVKNKNKVIQ